MWETDEKIIFGNQNDKQISTYSQGEEPFRNVVIALRRDGDRK